MSGDGGKGSTPRPFSVDQETFANNWDRIFNNKPLKNKLQELYDNQEELGEEFSKVLHEHIEDLYEE